MASEITSDGTKVKKVAVKSSVDVSLEDLVTSSNTIVGDVQTGEHTNIDVISGGDLTRVKKIIVGTPVRRVNPGSAGSINTLSGVDTSGATDGSVLVYHDSSGNWEAQLLLNKQTINGGHY